MKNQNEYSELRRPMSGRFLFMGGAILHVVNLYARFGLYGTIMESV